MPRLSSAEAEVERPGRLVLGSGSPRRQELLASNGISHSVRVADVDERPLWNDDLVVSAARSASAKFDALIVGLAPGETLLTADTLVGAGAGPLGKPTDIAHARSMLTELSGRSIEVVTALCVGTFAGREEITTVSTEVQLRPISPRELDVYLSRGRALDKAAALALQDDASDFVDRLNGCWSNVVGLPICAVRHLIGASDRRHCSAGRCGRLGRQ